MLGKHALAAIVALLLIASLVVTEEQNSGDSTSVPNEHAVIPDDHIDNLLDQLPTADATVSAVTTKGPLESPSSIVSREPSNVPDSYLTDNLQLVEAHQDCPEDNAGASVFTTDGFAYSHYLMETVTYWFSEITAYIENIFYSVYGYFFSNNAVIDEETGEKFTINMDDWNDFFFSSMNETEMSVADEANAELEEGGKDEESSSYDRRGRRTTSAPRPNAAKKAEGAAAAKVPEYMKRIYELVGEVVQAVKKIVLILINKGTRVVERYISQITGQLQQSSSDTTNSSSLEARQLGENAAITFQRSLVSLFGSE